MAPATQDQEIRRVMIGTLHGTIEGGLRASPRLRTLDFLNRSISRFVTIQDARVSGGEWQPEGNCWSIGVSTILWVAEIEAMRPNSGRRRAPLQSRTAVRLCMPGFELRGFLHTPAQGDAIARLNQDQSAFFALTSTSLMGAETEFAAAFLAVNRGHIIGAETLLDPDLEFEAEAAAFFDEELPVEVGS